MKKYKKIFWKALGNSAFYHVTIRLCASLYSQKMKKESKNKDIISPASRVLEEVWSARSVWPQGGRDVVGCLSAHCTLPVTTPAV